MKVETIGNATLYLGDAMDIIPTLQRVDSVITDPPYGVLDEDWDAMDTKQLARFTMRWVSMVAGITDHLVTFFGEKTRPVVSPLLHMLFPEVRQLIWNKQGGEIAENKFFYAFESIYLCHQGETWEVCEPKTMAVAAMITAAREAASISKGGVDMLIRGKKTGLCYRWEEAACLPTSGQADKLKAHLPLLGDDFDTALQTAYADKERALAAAKGKAVENAAKATDVLTFSPPTRKSHPCEKPVPLIERLIDASPKCQTVADVFMGSGSTGVACANMGRQFIGIEKDPKYFRIACERIAAAQAQERLFA